MLAAAGPAHFHQARSARFGADRATGPRVGHDDAVPHHERAVDQDMPDPRRRNGAVPVAGPIGDRGGIEHDHVGVGACPHAPLLAQGWYPVLQQALFMCAGWALMYWFYRRRIFFKA